MTRNLEPSDKGQLQDRSGSLVSTGVAQEVVSVASGLTTFTELVTNSDVLATRPDAVSVVFADGALVEFEPSSILIGASSASIINQQLGYTLSLELDVEPSLVYSAAAAAVIQDSMPSGPVQEDAQATQAPATIATIRVYRAQGARTHTQLGATASRRALSESSSAGGVVVEANEAERRRLMRRHENTRGGLIPILDIPPCERRSLEGQVAAGQPGRWNLLLGTTTAAMIEDLCAHLAGNSSYEAQCAEPRVGEGAPAVPIEISWNGISYFREAQRIQGNPFGVTAIEKDRVAATGKTIRHGAHAAPHEAHKEARRQLRQLLRTTVQGAAHADRRVRQLAATHPAFERARTKLRRKLAERRDSRLRRLDWNDEDFLYQKDGGISDPSFYDEYYYFARSWGFGGGTSTPFEEDWAWGLERLRHDADGPVVYDDDVNALLYTGEGVHLYVLDTGINYAHPDFAGRIAEGYNAYRDLSCAAPPADPTAAGSHNYCADEDGHGSHVAGTAAGATKGVASRAIIHPVRVFDTAGNNCIRGFIWAKEHFTTLRATNPSAKAVLVASLGTIGDRPSSCASRLHAQHALQASFLDYCAHLPP